MISKRIHCLPANDNYGRLANYIAGQKTAHQEEYEHGIETYSPQHYIETGQSIAGNRVRRLSECHMATGLARQERTSSGLLSFDARPDRRVDDSMRRDADIPQGSMTGEKCLMTWCAGCWAGDDYELAMQEVADTQALNTRTTQEKSYHLIVSFRPEDEDKLTPETFKAIEQRFADALGLSDHQRHCGVHINTENMHMHVAYNLIHPETLRRVEPWRDYIKRDKLCRELEREYGLTVDNGRDKATGLARGEKPATIEAHTGRKSFESYAHEQGEAILAKLKAAKAWDDVHRAFAEHGLELKPRGAGLIVKNRHGRQTAKASAVHRELSLKKLQDRFGVFQEFRGELPQSIVRYGAEPVQKAAKQNQLWDEFQEQRTAQKASISVIREKWQKKRDDLYKRPIARRTRANLIKLSRLYEADEVREARKECCGNWLDFLKDRASQGNEEALAILRSRHEEIAPEQPIPTERLQKWERYQASKIKILENTGLSAKSKQRLTSVALMESIAGNITVKISKCGSLIYALPNGGKICDTGRHISFTAEARTIASSYMAAKWNVRRRTVEKSSGDIIFTLAGGRQMRVPKGANVFERPTFHKNMFIEKNKEISM